jgi:Tfp pilus assembly protein PilN
MMPGRIGLFVDNGRLTVVGLAGREKVEHFVVEAAEDPAATLAAELQARGLTGRHVRVGLDRRLVVVKVIELPRTASADIGEMIGFDLERHVPFPAEGVRFDWVELPSEPEAPRHVLIAAAERRTVERPLGLLAAAHRRPAAVVVACHELPALLGREAPTQRAVWAHRNGEATDLLFLDERRLLMSRRVTAGTAKDLAREIQRSLSMVRWTDCEAVWLSGSAAEAEVAGLAALMGVPVSAPPYAADRASLVATLPEEEQGAALLALAVALGPRSAALNLLPAEARLWTPSREQFVTAGVIGVAALLGLILALTHVLKTERHLDRLSQEIRRLAPEVKAVERLAAELGQKRRVLAALEAAQDGRIPALPILRELTETLPQGAWLQGLTLERQGVELVGQSDAASALIPLLEASDRLERVEFTSPVTKTQNKEQFRLRAVWETRER